VGLREANNLVCCAAGVSKVNDCCLEYCTTLIMQRSHSVTSKSEHHSSDVQPCCKFTVPYLHLESKSAFKTDAFLQPEYVLKASVNSPAVL
jgi:hypothetical protein